MEWATLRYKNRRQPNKKPSASTLPTLRQPRFIPVGAQQWPRFWALLQILSNASKNKTLGKLPNKWTRCIIPGIPLFLKSALDIEPEEIPIFFLYIVLYCLFYFSFSSVLLYYTLFFSRLVFLNSALNVGPEEVPFFVFIYIVLCCLFYFTVLQFFQVEFI